MNEEEIEGIDNATAEELREMKTPKPEQEEGTQEGEADPVKELSEKLQKLEKQIADKNAFIGRITNELGALRKAARPKVTDEELLSNPVENTRKMILEEIEDRLGGKEQPAEDPEQTIKSWIPEYDTYVGDIIEVMKSDGADDNAIEFFKNNPSKAFPPVIMYQLAKRAIQERKIKDLMGKTERVNKAVSQATTSRMPNKSPSVKRDVSSISIDDLDSMSRDELEKLKKQLKER